MAQESMVMEKLARSLSETERRSLLAQIHKSLKDDDFSIKKMQRHQSEEEEIKVLLQRDLRQLSPFKYLILWLKRLFSGKTMLQVFREMKIHDLKKAVRHKNHSIVNFETRTLRPELAEEIFEIFVRTIPLEDLFRRLWSLQEDIGSFHQLVFALIEDHLDAPIESCYDLMPLDKMVEAYRSGMKEAVLNELNRKIDEHIGSIDSSRFSIVERQLEPIYNMRDLVLFPFQHLFQLFHGTIRQDDPEIKPLFQKTSAMTAIETIEELYYAAQSASKAEITGQLDSAYVKQLFRAAYGEEEDGDSVDSAATQVATNSDKFLDDLEELQKVCSRFIKVVPVPELIRALRSDPYYRMVVYVPKIEVESFYRGMKKLSLRNEIDDIIKEVRVEALTQERSELFHSAKMRALHYYRSYSSIDYEKLGVPSFRYYQGILVLFNFLVIHYKGSIQKMLQLVEGFVSDQDRITHERLLKHASAAEDSLYKIRELDDSLSSEQDDGKKFQKLRFEHGLESVQLKIYQNIMIKKDHEAMELLMQGRDAMRGIKQLLNDFLANSEEQFQEALRRKFLVQGQVQTLHQLIRQNILRISLLEQIEDQLDRIRDETGFDEVAL